MDPDTGHWKANSSSLMVQRYRFLSLLHSDIRDTRHIVFYDNTGRSDEAIIKHFKEEIGHVLVPKAVEYFPRHRWTGAEAVMLQLELFFGVHDLGREALLELMHAKPIEASAGFIGASQAIMDDEEEGYASEDERSLGFVPAGSSVVVGEKESGLTANSWVDYNQQAKTDLVTWVRMDPRPTVTIMSMVFKPISRVLHHKLHVASEKWMELNDLETARGHQRKYRVLESHSCAAEYECAKQLHKLLVTPEEWKLLRDEDRNLYYRGLAFRLLSRQAGGMLLLLVIPLRNNPHMIFKVLVASPDEIKELMDIMAKPFCMCDEFAYSHMKDYPDLGSEESRTVLATIAEILRDETSRMETGHAVWQREARLKSINTITDTILSASASTMFRTQRSIERRHVPKRAKPCEKVGRKQRTTMLKRPASASANGAQKNPSVKPAIGPYRLYLRENKGLRKGLFGKGVFKGRVEAYRAMLGTERHRELVQRAKACANAERLPAANAPECAAQPQPPQPQPDPPPSAIAIPSPSRRDESRERAIAVAHDIAGVLAVACDQSSREGIALIRSHMRGVAHECNALAYSDEETLQKWSEQRMLTLRDTDLFCSLGARGVSARPGVNGLTKLNWAVPAIGLAKEALCKLGEPTNARELRPGVDPDDNGDFNQKSIHKLLRDRWASRHVMYKHADQPKLGVVPPSKLTASMCRHSGTHFCHRADLKLFRGALIAVLRALFKKGGPCKDMFEDARGFLQVIFAGGAFGEDEDHYFHVPYVNQNSWAAALMYMETDDDEAAVRIATSYGNLALRAAPMGFDDDDDPQKAFDAMLLSVLPGGFFSIVDLGRRARYQVWELVDDKCREVPSDFIPAQVEVRRRSECAPFWPGTDAAIELARKQTSKASDTTDAKGSRNGKGAGPDPPPLEDFLDCGSAGGDPGAEEKFEWFEELVARSIELEEPRRIK